VPIIKSQGDLSVERQLPVASQGRNGKPSHFTNKMNLLCVPILSQTKKMERPENCISSFTGGDVINPPVSSPTGHIGSAASLPTDYEPGSWDVICQRGKDCHEHGM
jgi:hypothetical protein